jgi:hypothetical protein
MEAHSMPITTIQLDATTRRKLAGLKAHPRESYDELLNKLMRLIPEGDEEGKFSSSFRARLLAAEIEGIEGKAIPHQEAMRILGRLA